MAGGKRNEATTWSNKKSSNQGVVAVIVIQGIADELSEAAPPIAPQKPTRPGGRATGFRENVGRQDHHQRGPGLLAEIGEAEERNRQAMGKLGTKRVGGIRSRWPEGDVAGAIQGQLTLQQRLKTVRGPAADARRGRRDPGEGPRRL